MNRLYEVTYDILVQARTDSFLGSSRTDLMNLKSRVSAISPNQAQAIVEAQNGGRNVCVTKSAYPV